MTGTESVIFGPSVEFMWDTIPPDKRNQILEKLTFLAPLPPEQWPQDLVRRWGTSEPLYVLQLEDGLRVVFRRADDRHRLIAMEVFLQELIDFLFSGKPKAAPAP